MLNSKLLASRISCTSIYQYFKGGISQSSPLLPGYTTDMGAANQFTQHNTCHNAVAKLKSVSSHASCNIYFAKGYRLVNFLVMCINPCTGTGHILFMFGYYLILVDLFFSYMYATFF